MPRPVLVLLAVICLGPAGCGTFADAIGGPANDDLFYRGVKLDVQCIKEGRMFMAADLPLSALADTAMVPFIVYDEMLAGRPNDLQSLTGNEVPPLPPEPPSFPIPPAP